MTKRLEHIEAAKDECRILGATLNVEQQRKHFIGVIAYNGKTRKTSFSTTPSGMACHTVRRYIRRLVREMQE